MTISSDTPLEELVEYVDVDGVGLDHVDEPRVGDLSEADEKERLEAYIAHVRRRRLREVSTVFRESISRDAENKFSGGWTSREMNKWRAEKFKRAVNLFCVDPLLLEPLREAAHVIDDVAEKSREAYPRLEE